jgi:hypothetical protein
LFSAPDRFLFSAPDRSRKPAAAQPPDTIFSRGGQRLLDSHSIVVRFRNRAETASAEVGQWHPVTIQ